MFAGSRWNRRWCSAIALSASILLLTACADRAEEPPEESTEQTSMAAPPDAASRAYIDPQTGRLIPRPATGEGEEPAAQIPERLSRFQGDLVEVPLAEGGVMVDLKGRFRSETVVRLDENGELQVECKTAEGASHDGHEHAPVEGESQ